MKHFFICTNRLPPFKRHIYMEDGYYIDILGQMLIQMGYDIPPGCRTPADMRQLIPPFTYNQRGVIANTILTTEITMLDGCDIPTLKLKLPPLIEPYHIKVTFR